MAARDLFDLAVEWKELCVEAVATTVGGSIEHAFVSPGPPATDCLPQLAVYAGTPVMRADTSPLSPPLVGGNRDVLSGSVNLVNLTCVVVRCAPTIEEAGEIPAVADIEAAAQQVTEDVWAIWNFTRQRHKDGALFPSVGGRREMFLDPAFPIPPGTQEVGWQIPVRVSLYGYTPA